MRVSLRWVLLAVLTPWVVVACGSSGGSGGPQGDDAGDDGSADGTVDSPAQGDDSGNEAGTLAEAGPDEGTQETGPSEAGPDTAADQSAGDAWDGGTAADSDAGGSDATATDADASPASDAGPETGADAADGSADAGPDGADAGPACLGNTTIDFASLAPYWVDSSTSCGTATFGGNAVTLTRTGSCSADQQGGFISLDTTKWQLCGDFDMTVDFNLTQFGAPAGGSRWMAWHAYDPVSASPSGIAEERYDVAFSGCYPSSETYKSWTTSSSDCGGAIFRATTAVTGALRVARVGSTVTSYTWVPADAGADGGDAGGGSWSVFDTGTGMTTTPWTMVFYTGMYAGDGTNQTVKLSNLVITSSSTP